VTLSACDSGTGAPGTAAGVRGLRTAIQTAGASSWVVSLWPVDDKATSALMQHFYRDLVTGRARDRALREAKEAIRASSEWSHPYYWAGFVLGGPAATRPLNQRSSGNTDK